MRRCGLTTRRDIKIAGAAWLILALAALTAQSAGAASYQPDLGMGRIVIDGGQDQPAGVSANSEIFTVYPLSGEQPRELLSEVPGQPFRPLDPAPRSFAFWKVPVYAVLGFPRDAVDGVFGVVNYVPVLNLPVVFGAYEFVPTQAFMRDWRDWHKWPGRRNQNGHGMYDALAVRDLNQGGEFANTHERHGLAVTEGVTWGWFPSFNRWSWTYESKWKKRRWEKYNAKLQGQLRELNTGIETGNQAIAFQQMTARKKALDAIEAGNGKEASYRMVPYDSAYMLDEGAFALLATGLALYIDEGPEWVGPLLWEKLRSAQSADLAQAERMLSRTVRRYPNRPGPWQSLIYVRLLQDRSDEALEAASGMIKASPGSPLAARLWFETALSAGEKKEAARALAACGGDSDLPLMKARLALSSDGEQARTMIEELVAERPDDPEANYLAGCAALMAVEKSETPLQTLQQAVDALERAALTAQGAALKVKAGRALGVARGAMDRAGKQAEAFAPAAIKQ